MRTMDIPLDADGAHQADTHSRGEWNRGDFLFFLYVGIWLASWQDTEIGLNATIMQASRREPSIIGVIWTEQKWEQWTLTSIH